MKTILKFILMIYKYIIYNKYINRYLNDTGLSEIPNGVFNLTTLTRL